MTGLLVALACCTLMFTNAFEGDDVMVVVIDAGHGGHDHGANVQAISEKQLTYAIAEKIKDLGNKNVKVILTRRGDEFVSLK